MNKIVGIGDTIYVDTSSGGIWSFNELRIAYWFSNMAGLQIAANHAIYRALTHYYN